MKHIIAILAAFFALNTAFASLNQDDVLKAMSGQWSLKLNGEQVKFLIRSNGDVKVISNQNRDYVEVSLSFNNSTSSWGMDGLPVGHIIISEGSDEDVRDVHFLVTALQDYSQTQGLKKLAAFTTFNDGPNEFADAETSWSEFKKYDAKSKKWVEVK